MSVLLKANELVTSMLLEAGTGREDAEEEWCADWWLLEVEAGLLGFIWSSNHGKGAVVDEEIEDPGARQGQLEPPQTLGYL
jgi:hypothetical protein